MSRLERTTPHNTRALAWSVSLYRWLLLGVGRLWLRTLADLAVSALAEHIAGGIRMSRWTPARYCAFATMLGGAIWIGEVLYNIGAAIVTAATGSAAYTGPDIMASYVFAAAWMLFPIGLMGLLMLAAGRVGVLSWLGYTIAFAGGLMLLVGDLGTTYARSYAAYVGGVQVVHLSGSDLVSANLKLALYQISFLGYPVLGTGLALVGLALWRARALPRFNLLPLGLGVFAALQYFFTDMGAPSLLRNTGTPGLLVMVVEFALFVLAWAVGWMLLGRTVWVAMEAPSPAMRAKPVAGQAQTAAG